MKGLKTPNFCLFEIVGLLLMLKFHFFRIESGGFGGDFNGFLVDFDLR